MKKLLLLSAGILSFTSLVQAQTGISAAGTAPDASAMLDVIATDKGFLAPRVALLANNNSTLPIPSPAAGLLVYNTATAGSAPNNVTPGYYYWDGTVSLWQKVSAGNTLGFIENRAVDNNFGAGQAASFDITGNAEIGGTLEVNGNVGIGTTTPLQKLEIGVNGGLGFSGTGLNSADKKLYSPADGDLEWMTHNSAGAHGFAVSHQGTKAVYLNTSGNSYLNGGSVGIGTSSPASLLSVGSSSQFQVNSSGQIPTIQGFSPANMAVRMTPNFHLNSMAGNAVVINYDNGGSGTFQTFRIGNGASSDVFYVQNNGSFYSGGSATINTNVLANGLINTNTGYTVSGSATPGTYLRGNGTYYVSSTIQAGDIPSLSGNYVDLTTAQTAAGIKTWSSQAKFSNAIQPSVGNATTVGLYWPTDPGGGSGDAAWMRYYVESGENTKLQIGIGNDPDDDISFYQSGIEAMNIYNGLVGINKTAPESRLHISGGVPTGIGALPASTVAIIENGTANNYLTFRNTGDNNTYAGIQFQDNNVGGYIAFRNCCTGNSADAMLYGAYQDHIFQNGTAGTVDGLTETMRIKQNGNVGIGGIVSPSYKLQVSGDIYANGGWLRVSGNQGLYFESWGGGWYMSDATYMRTYNNKAVLTSGGLYTQGTASTLYGTNASIYANNANVAGGGIMVSDDGGFFDYNDGPVTFNGSTGLVIAGNSGSGSSNAYLRVKQLAGTGNRPVYADANGTLTTTGCRSGFWAVADGRICVESTLRGPNNAWDAIGVCKGVAPGCRVCEHNDLQQACGSGIGNPYGATYGWYGDHGVASGGNWDDEFGVWNSNGCANNNDDPARHGGDHSLNYRCCY